MFFSNRPKTASVCDGSRRCLGSEFQNIGLARGVIKKDLDKTEVTWEEAQSASLNRQEWRRSVAQFIHLEAG